jgi:hypothetical protein
MLRKNSAAVADCQYTGAHYMCSGSGVADRELLAATLNTVHRKELLNG